MINFLRRNIVWFFSISLLLIAFAFVTGLTVKNWPLIEFDSEFKISDVLNLILTCILAFLVPIWINHFIEKGNKVNEVVYNEVSRYRDHIEEIHSRFIQMYSSKTLSNANKVELNILSEILDTKFEILKTILTQRCKSNANGLIKSLSDNQVLLWQCITGSKIDSQETTNIPYELYQEEIKLYQEISATIVKINLLVTDH